MKLVNVSLGQIIGMQLCYSLIWGGKPCNRYFGKKKTPKKFDNRLIPLTFLVISGNSRDAEIFFVLII